MTKDDIIKKRLFDLFFSVFGLFLLWWFILFLAFFGYVLSGENGFFIQNRIGQNGVLFKIFKIRTLSQNSSSIFEYYSAFLRRKKLDELPQLLNILLGDMSFVGPRPDVSGFADELKGDYIKILKLKPGITGPASLAFFYEEDLLNNIEDKEEYNKNIIWPQKNEINLAYYENYSLSKDFYFFIKTLYMLIF